MNHYPHHIGDFDRATRHLTRIERSVYRDLIDLYYETESELTLDVTALCRRIIARTNEESTAVEQVLNEFFIKTARGWFHCRCDDEIEHYRANNTQKAAAGKASAAKRAAKKQQALNGNSTDVEHTLNEPSTDVQRHSNGTPTNQEPEPEPITKNKTTRKNSQPIQPADVSDSVWSDFMQIRKAKRSPLTKTALDGIAAEADKAGITLQNALEQCCARGWQGFKASWAIEANQARPTSTPNRQEALEARNQAVAEEFARNLQ